MSEQENEVEEMEISISDLFKSVISRIWIIILCFVVCTALAVFYVQTATPIYEVSTSIMVEPIGESSDLSNLFGTAISNTGKISTEIEIMNSRTTYRNALSKLDLTQYTTAEGVRYSDLEHPLDYETLKESVSITPVKDTNFVRISVKNSSPEFARDFCNMLAESYSDMLTGISRNSVESQLEFVSSQIPEIERELENASLKLSRFQKEYSILQMEEESKLDLAKLGYYSLVEEPLMEERLDAEKILRDAEFENPELADIRIAYTASEDVEMILSDIYAWYREELLYDVLASTAKSQIQVLSKSQSERYYALTLMMEEAIVELENNLINISDLVDVEYAAALSQYLVSWVKLDVLADEKLVLNEKLSRLPEIERQLTELKADVQLYHQLSLKLREMESETALLKASVKNNVTSIDKAELPIKPVAPSKFKIVILGAFLGIFAGAGIAVVLGLLDRTIKNRDDLSKALGPDIPMLGWIPLSKPANSSDIRKKEMEKEEKRSENPEADVRSSLAMAAKPMSFISERYKHIAYALIYGRTLGNQHITVCSTDKSDGKSSTLANIAYALALNGKRVLVVDLDIRKPSVDDIFEITDSEKGIVDLLLGKEPIDRCIRVPYPELPGLNTIGVGKVSIVPSLVIQSDRISSFIKAVDKYYDFIFFDAPPLTFASEIMTIAHVVPDVFLVTRAGITRSDDVKLLKTELSSCKANIVGVCLNGLALKETSFGNRRRDGSQKSGYGYGYGYGYGESGGEERIRRDYVFSPKKYRKIYQNQVSSRFKTDEGRYLYDAPLAFPDGMKMEDEVRSSVFTSFDAGGESGIGDMDSFLSAIENDADASGKRE